jgi:hypothetical protein
MSSTKHALRAILLVAMVTGLFAAVPAWSATHSDADWVAGPGSKPTTCHGRHCPTPTTPPVPTPATTTPPTTPQAGTCASSTRNVPDGPDGRGGCFPGPSNTGPNAPASAMSVYTGPCTITTANTVIDSKVVNCTLVVQAGGFVLKNSYLNGWLDQVNGATFTVQDSFIDSGVQYPACANNACPAGKYACTQCSIGGSNFTVLRTESINTNRAVWCDSHCLIQDNYFHGTNLWPDDVAHASAMREEQYGTIRHNTLWCSFNGPFLNNDIGCSADLTGYPDFAPIHHNTVDGNLFMANPGDAYCMYGGGTSGKPYSGDPTNATYQVFTNNVFQRGSTGRCAAYGPVTNFITGRTGNVWSGNVWDDGTTVPPG